MAVSELFPIVGTLPPGYNVSAIIDGARLRERWSTKNPAGNSIGLSDCDMKAGSSVVKKARSNTPARSFF